MITRDIGLYHLFYADDVFLFGEASWANLDLILGVLNEFEQRSGLFLNTLKATIIVPRKMYHNIRQSIASCNGLCVSLNFGKYLGVHISAKKLRKSDYLELVKQLIELGAGRQNF